MKKIAILVLPFLVACSNVTTTSDTKEDEKQNEIAHVILLAGGENCLGYSYSYHLQELEGVSKEKFNEYQKGYSNVKISFKNMLNSGLIHKEQTNFVNTRIGQGKAADEGYKYGCLGPEVGIAEYLSNMRPNEDYYIIKFAGGEESSFAYQWNIDHGIYYHKMLEFFDQQLARLTNDGINFDVSSFMFVQGETDAKNANSRYKDYLIDFVNDIKLRYKDFAPSNGMSFIDAGISSYYHLTYQNINNAKKEIMKSDKRHFYIDTIAGDITRNQDNMDRIHYDAKGEIKLGNLFAKAYLSMQNSTISKGDFAFNEKTNEPLFIDNYVVETIRNGQYIKANYNFDNGQINVDVLDNNLSSTDGVSLKYCISDDETQLQPSNLRKVNFYLDNKIEFLKYSVDLNDFVSSSSEHGFTNSIKGLTNDKGELIGYRMGIQFSKQDSEKMYLSYGVLKNNFAYYKHYEKLVHNEPDTYPYIEQNVLKDNKNVINGEFFGSVSNLKATKGWDLSNDINRISILDGQALNTIFAYQRNDINMMFATFLNAKKVINFDLWPKFGITIVDEEFNGIFYYVDAYGNGTTMEGTDLGYCKIIGGTFSNYVSLNYSVGVNSSVYQNNNYISLGIDRREDQYRFLLNGEVVKTIQNVTNLGLRKAYFGINTFNVSVNAQNYFFS